MPNIFLSLGVIEMAIKRIFKSIIKVIQPKKPQRIDFPESGSVGKITKLEEFAASELFNKGVSLANLSKFQEAIACYDKILEFYPRYAKALYNKGSVLQGLGKYQEAIVCYDKALEVNPKYDAAWNNKGGVLQCLGKYQEAIDCFDKILELNPNALPLV
jgi:tetratricopeptide (TPR) repeat protein